MANSNTGDFLQSPTATGGGAGPRGPSLGSPAVSSALAATQVAMAAPALAATRSAAENESELDTIPNVSLGHKIIAANFDANLVRRAVFDSAQFNASNHSMGRRPTASSLPDHRTTWVKGMPLLSVSGSPGRREMMPTFFPVSLLYESEPSINPTTPDAQVLLIELEFDLVKPSSTKKDFTPPRRVVLFGQSTAKHKEILLFLGDKDDAMINIEPGLHKTRLIVNGKEVSNFPKQLRIQTARGNQASRIAKRNGTPQERSETGPSKRSRTTASATHAPSGPPSGLPPASSTATSPAPSSSSSPTASQLSLATSASVTQYDLPQPGTYDASFVQYDHTTLQTQEPSPRMVGAQTVQLPSGRFQHPGVAGPTVFNTIGSQHAAIQPPQPAPTIPNHILQLTQEQMVTVVTALGHAGLFLTVFPAHGSSTSAPALANPFMTQAMQHAAALPGFANCMPMRYNTAQQQPLAYGHSGHAADNMVMPPCTVSATMIVPQQDLAPVPVTPNMALQRMVVHQSATPASSLTAAYPQLPTNRVHQTASAAPPMTDIEDMLMFLDNPSSMAAPNQVLASPPPPSPTLSLDTTSSFAGYEISASSSPDVNSYGSEYVDWHLVETQASAAGGIESHPDREDDSKLMAWFKARTPSQ